MNREIRSKTQLFLYSSMICSLLIIGMGHAVPDNELSCEVKVEELPEGSRFILSITNNSDEENLLKFPTSQQYDFIVRSSNGEIVWKWSEGRMFAQVLTELAVKPHEEITFAEEYSFSPGRYNVQGILMHSPEELCTGSIDFIVTSQVQPVLRGRIAKILDKIYLLGNDGISYLIENPDEEIINLENKEVEITSYETSSIEGTIDKKITIKEYKK